MKLHHSPFSPFARQVRVALHELGLDDAVSLVETPVSPVERNADYAAVNPLRRLPALELENGHVLPDSVVILLYLDDRVRGRLLPEGSDRFATLAAHSVAQGAMEQAVGLRYETALRPEALRWPVWIDDRWDKIDAALGWFEPRLTTPAATLDMAQIGLGCLLGYLDFRFGDHSWRSSNPSLASWYASLAARPSLAATAPVA